MVIPVVILNLFVVPAVAVRWYYETRGRSVEASVKLLLEYEIFTACNVPLTKIGVFLIRLLTDREISLDSGYYTLLAIGAAIVLGLLADPVRVRLKEVPPRQMAKDFLTKRTMEYRQKLFIALPLVLLIVITYIIRIPLEIYAGNTHEFLFTLSDFLPWMLIIGTISLLAISCLLAMLPDKPFRLASAIILWFGTVSWIQDLFLNKTLTDRDGGPMDWTDLGLLPKRNLLVWIFLLMIVVFLCIRVKRSAFRWFQLISISLCLIQLIAVGSVLLTMPEKKIEDRFLSGENQMCLGSKENTIVLVIDSAGIDNLKKMAEQYPEVKDIVKDFTYYSNVCYDYDRTFPSVTHFLTGVELDFEAKATDWHRTAWNCERTDRFYQILRQGGYERRLYTPANLIGYVYGEIGNLDGKFDNVQGMYGQEVDECLLISKLLRSAFFRCAPYLCKPYFEVLTSDFGDIVTLTNVQDSTYANIDFYGRLMEEGLSVDSDVEKLISVSYLQGMHRPYDISAEADYLENVTREEALRGVFKILQEYFDQMKELGVYDNANIIVMADHSCELYDRKSPVFFLKRSGEIHEQTEVNSAPVDYNDFQATILDLIGENDGSFGKSFFDWKPGDERYRTVYIMVEDENYPPVDGALRNTYYGYTYNGDVNDLYKHEQEDGPDIIVPTNRWW